MLIHCHCWGYRVQHSSHRTHQQGGSQSQLSHLNTLIIWSASPQQITLHLTPLLFHRPPTHSPQSVCSGQPNSPRRFSCTICNNVIDLLILTYLLCLIYSLCAWNFFLHVPYTHHQFNTSQINQEWPMRWRSYNPVTPNPFSLRPSERAENGMLPEGFEWVQSSGRPSPLR